MLKNEPLLDTGGTSDYTSDEGQDDLIRHKGEHDDKAEWHFWASLFWSILEIVLVSALLLAPSIGLLLWKNYQTYDLLVVKPPDKGTNAWHEFMRWSIFIAASYDAWVAARWLSMAIPAMFKAFVGVSKDGRKVSRHFVYLQTIAGYTRTFLFFAFEVVLGAMLLYHPQAWTPGTDTLAAGITTWQFYFEHLGIVLVIVLGFVTLEKWLIRMIAVAFHRSAFMDRVRQLNFRYAVIRHLLQWAQGGRTGTFGLAPLTAPRRESRDIAALTELEQAHTADLEHARREGRRIAADILRALPGHDKIALEHLRVVFPESRDPSIADYRDAFAVFAIHDDSTSISRDEFINAIVDVLEQRRNIQLSMKANSKIVRKLDHILLLIALVMATTVAAPFYNINLLGFMAGFGILAGTLAVLFRNVAQSIFNAFLFVFIEHAFDVGDRVSVGAENYTVEDIEIFTTTLIKWDGIKVYWPNSVLSTRDIENIRRSACQSETFDIIVSSSTTTDKLWELKKLLVDYAKSESDDFTGYIDIASVDVVSHDTMKVQLIVQYRSNFQDQARRYARKSKFGAAVRDIVGRAGITYFS